MEQIIAVGLLFILMYFGPMAVLLMMDSLRSRKFESFANANKFSYERLKLPTVLAPNKPYTVRKAAGVLNSTPIEIEDVLVWDGGFFSMNNFGLFMGFNAFNISQYTIVKLNQSVFKFQRMQRPKFQQLSDAESVVTSRIGPSRSSWYGDLNDIHKYIFNPGQIT